MSTAQPTLGPPGAKPGADRRILLLSTNLDPAGGAEGQVFELGRAIHARGWTVEFVSLLPPTLRWAVQQAAGIPVTSLKMRRGVPDVTGLLRLKKVLSRFNPHIVHSHMTHANLLARAARLCHRVPVLICTLHGLKMHRVKGGSTRLREVAHRLTDGLTDLTTTVCQAAAVSYVENRSVPAHKISVIPNGVDTAQYRPDSSIRDSVRSALGLESRFVWLAVGRFEKPKAYGTLIRAFAKVVQAGGGPTTLLICGRGSLEAEVRRQVSDLGIEQCVRFLGFRGDVPELMNAADGQVLSSETEGLPMVLLQASASGLPIVATSVGGVPEVVEDGVTGYLSSTGDVDALAGNMMRVAALSPADRMAMGMAGRARTAALFDANRVYDQWERLYSELLAAYVAAGERGRISRPEFRQAQTPE